MAEAVVSMVIEGLKGALIEEVKFLSGVGDQIEHAKIDLLLMHGFLKDADAKQGDNEVVRIWVRIIRDVAYDLEDVIESFALKVALKRGGSGKLVLKRLACIFNKGINLHKIGSEIESITVKLSKLRASLQGYNCCARTTPNPLEPTQANPQIIYQMKMQEQNIKEHQDFNEVPQ
ncbi:hypothetical protein ACFX2I_039766 [Malus domestica]